MPTPGLPPGGCKGTERLSIVTWGMMAKQPENQGLYNAAVVGCGLIGCAFDDDPSRGYVSTHAGAYSHSDRIRLIGLCDSDRARVDRYADKFGVPDRYGDLDSLLASEPIDILSVCTWPESHVPIIAKAAEAGVKAVWCEKPLSESLADADFAVDIAKRHGTLVVVNHLRRFHPAHQAISQYIRSGGLGRVQQVTAYYTGGVAHTGTHMFDLLRFYLGAAEWVQARLSVNVDGMHGDPNFDAWIGFECGCVASLQALDSRDYVIFEVKVFGTRGSITVSSSGFNIEHHGVAPSERFGGLGLKELRPEPAPFATDQPWEFMLYAVAEIVDALDKGRPAISSVEDGRDAVELICACHKSARTGARIDLPLDRAGMAKSR